VVEGDAVLLDGLERGFSLAALSLLAGLAGLDISDDIFLHSRPVVVLGDLLKGVVLAKVASEWGIMVGSEGFDEF
jgi:hypothetical protein